MDLVPVKLTISENQFDKLRLGHPIQVNKTKLKKGNHVLYVNPVLAKKIKKAKRLNKGVRIQLSKQELEISAEGLKDFLKKAKKWYDKHVKKTVGPLLRKGAEEISNIALDTAETFAPSLKPTLEKGRKFIPNIVGKVGDITGAFGVYQGMPVVHCGGCSICKNALKPSGSFKPAGGGAGRRPVY